MCRRVSVWRSYFLTCLLHFLVAVHEPRDIRTRDFYRADSGANCSRFQRSEDDFVSLATEDRSALFTSTSVSNLVPGSVTKLRNEHSRMKLLLNARRWKETSRFERQATESLLDRRARHLTNQSRACSRVNKLFCARGKIGDTGTKTRNLCDERADVTDVR